MLLATMLYIAQVIHLLGVDIQHPQWDTLIGLLNTSNTPTVARFRIWNEQDGSLVQWPRFDGGQQDHCDVTLKPQSSWAATFIDGNGFNKAFGADCGSPQGNFMGHAIVETDGIVYGWSMVSGGNWDSKAPSVYVPVRQQLFQRFVWLFPYVIPVFEDANHVGSDSYTTGLSIQNFTAYSVPVTVTYTVNQNYPNAGQAFSFNLNIPANGGWRGDLYQQLSQVGFPPINSEGWLKITAAGGGLLFPSAIIATKNYLFSAGADFQ